MAGVKPSDARLAFIFGEETFEVLERARSLYGAWCGEAGGMDHEIIDAAAGNADEALRAVGRLREALQTLPFFGGSKVIWFRGCSFLGEDRTAESGVVKETLAELAGELERFNWRDVRLIVSAGKTDKRRVFFKAMERLGLVEEHRGLSADMKDWGFRAERLVESRLRAAGKGIDGEALASMVARVGPNVPMLVAEADKVAAYVGGRDVVETADVEAVVVRNKQARAFALGDALGDRDVPKMLRALDEELWLSRVDRDHSRVGLVYALASKVRSLLLAKELLREGWVKPEKDFQRFRPQLERLPAGRFSEDRRYNPAMVSPYVLFRAVAQAPNYSESELVGAMEKLLACNLSLVTSSAEEEQVLQRTLVEIARRS